MAHRAPREYAGDKASAAVGFLLAFKKASSHADAWRSQLAGHSPTARLISALLLLASGLIVTACGPGQAAVIQTRDQQVQVAGPKRFTAAIRAAPASLVLLKTQRGGALRGLDAIEQLTHAGLSYIKADGTRAA